MVVWASSIRRAPAAGPPTDTRPQTGQARVAIFACARKRTARQATRCGPPQCLLHDTPQSRGRTHAAQGKGVLLNYHWGLKEIGGLHTSGFDGAETTTIAHPNSGPEPSSTRGTRHAEHSEAARPSVRLAKNRLSGPLENMPGQRVHDMLSNIICSQVSLTTPVCPDGGRHLCPQDARRRRR